jgi:protocatechuate 3,4-dioxygenase beta subunit
VKRFSLMLLLATLAASACSRAHSALGNLAGNVIDSHGHPVANAVVIIQTSDGEHPHAAHTDSDGNFSFERYSPGQYDLRASIYGIFTDWSRRVVIHAGRTTHVTLHLPAAVK